MGKDAQFFSNIREEKGLDRYLSGWSRKSSGSSLGKRSW